MSASVAAPLPAEAPTPAVPAGDAPLTLEPSASVLSAVSGPQTHPVQTGDTYAERSPAGPGAGQPGAHGAPSSGGVFGGLLSQLPKPKPPTGQASSNNLGYEHYFHPAAAEGYAIGQAPGQPGHHSQSVQHSPPNHQADPYGLSGHSSGSSGGQPVYAFAGPPQGQWVDGHYVPPPDKLDKLVAKGMQKLGQPVNPRRVEQVSDGIRFI